ncbi:MAG: S-adenosylmethionine:tRNA ribosyltransferase-isomerase [Actinomycetota bacterium]|nr:S-adenosylmethionine:tRNA ribosyltransferase-isomerase [Actinomycetota bacterium]
MIATEVRKRFELPPELSADAPPEERGLARDAVRLMVAGPGGVRHAQFRDIGSFLRAGDLVVVNTSATIPAAVDATRACDEHIAVHFSTPRDDGTWIIELRLADRTGPVRDAVVGETVELAGGASAVLVAPHPDVHRYVGSRLWRAQIICEVSVADFLATHARPITYAYVRQSIPPAAYQTIFSREPGSAEMPSAARPFTHELVTELVTRGIGFATVVLHTGVSSQEAGEPPEAERFWVPSATARRVNETRSAGGRVIAVGTTVTRALESVAHADGRISGGQGWTELFLGPDRPALVVDGLVTGWHAPEASHLLLLEAVGGDRLVGDAYDAALAARYLWHEFGDSCLLLPATR